MLSNLPTDLKRESLKEKFEAFAPVQWIDFSTGEAEVRSLPSSHTLNSSQYIPIPFPFGVGIPIPLPAKINSNSFSLNSNSFFPNNIVTFLDKMVVTYYGNYNGTISTYDTIIPL